jgi:hypothetical protein
MPHAKVSKLHAGLNEEKSILSEPNGKSEIANAKSENNKYRK